MGGCFSSPDPSSNGQHEVKLTKLASLKLGAASGIAQKYDDSLTPVQALLADAKTLLDSLAEQESVPAPEDFEPAKAKIQQAQELLNTVSGAPVDEVESLQANIYSAKEALAGAIVANKQWMPIAAIIDAANDADIGAQTIEKVAPGKSKDPAVAQMLVRVTSKVEEAAEAAGTAALDAKFGDGASASDLGAASVKINDAIDSLAEAMLSSPPEVAAELAGVKASMVKAASSMEKATSFK